MICWTSSETSTLAGERRVMSTVGTTRVVRFALSGVCRQSEQCALHGLHCCKASVFILRCTQEATLPRSTRRGNPRKREEGGRIDSMMRVQDQNMSTRHP